MKSFIFNIILSALFTVSLKATEYKKLFESDFSSTDAALAQFHNKDDLMKRKRTIVENGELVINAVSPKWYVTQWLRLRVPEKMPEVFSIQIDFTVMSRKKKSSNFFRCNIGKVTLLNRQYASTYLDGKKEVKIKGMKGTPSNNAISTLLVSFPDKLVIYRGGKKVGTVPVERGADSSISLCSLDQKTMISKIIITEGDASKQK